MHFPNIFWGVGNETPDAASDPFTQSGGATRATFVVRIFEEVYRARGWARLPTVPRAARPGVRSRPTRR